MKFVKSLSLFVSSIAGAVAMSGRGRMTYYGNGGDCPSDMALPACGYVNFDTQYYVAMNWKQYDTTLTNYANPNSATICNTCIKITYGNKSVIGRVIDKCPGCPEGGIDVSLPLFSKLADPNLGVVDASWETSSCDGLILTSFDTCNTKAHDNEQPKKVSNTSSKKQTSQKSTVKSSEKTLDKPVAYINKTTVKPASIRVASTSTTKKQVETVQKPKPTTTQAPEPVEIEEPNANEAPNPEIPEIPEVPEVPETTPVPEADEEAPANNYVVPEEIPTDISSEAYFTYLKYELDIARADIEEARREKEAARKEAEEAEKEKLAAIEDLKTITEEKLALADEAERNGNKSDAKRIRNEAKKLEKEALIRQGEAVKREQQALAREVAAKAKESAALAREASILLKQKEALEAQQRKVDEAVKSNEASPAVGAVASAVGVAAILCAGGFTLKKYSPNSYESIKRNLSVKKLPKYEAIKRNLSVKKIPQSYESVKRRLSLKLNKDYIKAEQHNVDETYSRPSAPRKTYVREVSINMEGTEGNRNDLN